RFGSPLTVHVRYPLWCHAGPRPVPSPAVVALSGPGSGVGRPTPAGPRLLGVLHLLGGDVLLAVLGGHGPGHGALLAGPAADLLVVLFLVALVEEVVGDLLAALLDLDGRLALRGLFQGTLGA